MSLRVSVFYSFGFSGFFFSFSSELGTFVTEASAVGVWMDTGRRGYCNFFLSFFHRFMI